MAVSDEAIVEYASAALLRYFRKGFSAVTVRTRFDIARDIDFLIHHWAISDPVLHLTSYLLGHRQEVQALLTYRSRVDDSVVRGRIDAARTVLHQLRSGLATAVVSYEPTRSFNTGPNQVLAWVLHHARMLTTRLLGWQDVGSGYETRGNSIISNLNQIYRLEALRDALGNPAVNRRPGPGALRDAARSRRQLYRSAVSAFDLLRGVEAGSTEAIDAIVRTTLIGPLESWRRFELAVAMAMGEAVAEHYSTPLRISVIGGASDRPLLSCGPFDIYWQNRSPFFAPAAPEPSEEIVSEIVRAYGFQPGQERPDFVVVDRELGRVAAVAEAKYLLGDTASARFRDAAEQIVLYSRSYSTASDLTALIGRSLIILSDDAPEIVNTTAAGVPAAVDFGGITHGALSAWCGRLRT
jgi:hypothetical protein